VTAAPPPASRVLDPKVCKEVEAFAANYRGRVTDPGRDSVLGATK
jgi:hypothetical protein